MSRVGRWLARTPRSVSLRSLAAGRPTPAQAIAFVADELPIRNAWLASQLGADAATFAHVEEFDSFLSHLAHAADELAAAAAAAPGEAGANVILRTHDAHEAAVRALVPRLRDASDAEAGGAQWLAVQRVSTRIHRQLVAQRVLVAHLSAAVADSGAATAGSGALAVDNCDLVVLARTACEDAALGAREKYGDAPAFDVHAIEIAGQSAPSRCCTVAPYVFFVLMELLKNAAGAHVRRYGVLDLCDAPPIRVCVSVGGALACVRVEDHGGGMSPRERQSALAYFYTTHEQRAATYTYSRAFGEQFAGQGVGLPLAAAHARYLGGDIVLASMPDDGVAAYLTIDRTGGQATDPPAHTDEFGGG